MNPDKKIIVDQLLEKVNAGPYVLVVDYTGMTVPQFNEVRKRLRESGAKLHVTKNSYVKALGEAKGFPKELEADLKGQSAIIFGSSDVCAAAKVVKSFGTEFKKPVMKSGVLDGTFLTAEEVGSLADVGSRDNLLAKLLGVLNAPAGALARVIQARVDKDGEAAPAAAAEEAPAAPAAEAPAAEAPAAPAAEA
ncbi:MAG: beta-defensin antibiotic precursor antimicrobial defensin beta signal defensin bd-32 defb-32 [Labilithrix sp.]|nr:beta-defensin antibiotic precursor antimicrobial defensin beta signal defensin bd-32 defb-32 [Labilithrix sp.]